MRVERTHDASEIRKVICNLQVLTELGALGEPPVPIHETIYHLIAKDKDVMGVASFFPIDGKAWSPHMAVLPEYRGIGTEFLQQAIGWMLEHSPCKALRVAVPAWNERMVHVFEKCGFSREKLQDGSLMMERN